MSGSSTMVLCEHNVHITVNDVTTWSWVILVNPVLVRKGSCQVQDKSHYVALMLICACVVQCVTCMTFEWYTLDGKVCMAFKVVCGLMVRAQCTGCTMADPWPAVSNKNQLGIRMSIHKLMSPFFFGITTSGKTHGVGPSIFSMIPNDSKFEDNTSFHLQGFIRRWLAGFHYGSQDRTGAVYRPNSKRRAGTQRVAKDTCSSNLLSFHAEKGSSASFSPVPEAQLDAYLQQQGQETFRLPTHFPCLQLTVTFPCTNSLPHQRNDIMRFSQLTFLKFSARNPPILCHVHVL